MNYAEKRRLDVQNGKGIRATLFVSGCNFKCEGCFNEKAQDFNYGRKFTKEVEDEFIEDIKSPKVDGVNILGGEPLQQDPETMLRLVKRIKEETGKPIWLWTGFKFEEIIKLKDKFQIIKYVEVLIDGKFELDKRDLKLMYRGSSNQRVIDVEKSINENKVVLYIN